jgi:hypothetical protein
MSRNHMLNATTQQGSISARMGSFFQSFPYRYLGFCLAYLACIPATTLAVSYQWNTAASGNWNAAANWTPNGDPNNVADSATVNATGSPYTVTVNAPRAIGTITLNSANATLNASSTLTVATLASLQSGNLQGTLLMNANGSALSLNRANVGIPGTTTYQFRRGVGNINMSQTFDAGNLTSSETLDILQTDAPYNRAFLSVTTANGFTNNGTINIRPQGYAESSLNYTLTSGTLTNANIFKFNNTGATLNDGQGAISANILNSATGVLTITSGGSSLRLTKSAATYENQGSWTVTGNALRTTGNGSSFAQATSGASLTGPTGAYWEFGKHYVNEALGAKNTFSVTAGSAQGNFELHNTDLTLGAGRTVAGPTNWRMIRDGGDQGNTNVSLATAEIRANETLRVENSNTGGVGYRYSHAVTATSALANYGTILIADNFNYHDNADQSELIVAAGLTNHGQLTLQDSSTAAGVLGARLSASLTNAATGNVSLSTSTNGQTRLGTTGSNHVNNGQISVIAGTRNFVEGSTLNNAGIIHLAAGTLDVNVTTFTNQTAGKIRGLGTLDVLGTTGGLNNQGTIAPGLADNTTGILSVLGNTNFGAGSKLVIDVLGAGTVAGTDYDRLAVTGSVTGLSNATLVVNINELLGTGDFTGDTLTILTTTTGNLSNQSFGAVQFVGGLSADVTYLTNSITLSNFTQIPEPATGLMLLLGLVGCSIRNRRRTQV